MPVGLICVVCDAPFSVRPSRVAKGAKYCSYRCHQIGEGRKGGFARGEQMKAASNGVAYTKTNGRHTHRVVMERAIGRPLAPGEVVHHRDGNILNNDPSNLVLCADQAEHMRLFHPEVLKRGPVASAAARRKKGGSP